MTNRSCLLFGDLDNQGLWIIHGIPAENATTHCTLWSVTYSTNVEFTSNIAVVDINVERHEQLDTTYITNYVSLTEMVNVYSANQRNASYLANPENI